MKLQEPIANATVTKTLRFALEDAPVVSFGQAGMLAPTSGSATANQSSTNTLGTTFTIVLYAKNRNNIGFTGTWGSPHRTEVPSYEFGYGGCGIIEDLPLELRRMILDALKNTPTEQEKRRKS